MVLALTQAAALLLTVVPETIVVSLYLRRSLPGTALIAVGANLISHPLLWALYGAFPSILLLEPGVVLLEAAIYHLAGRQPLRRALVASVLANVASLTIGIVLAQ